MTKIGPLHRCTAPSRTLLWSEYLRASAETAAYLAPEKVRCVNTLGSRFLLGMRVHPHVLEIVLDRLRQPVGARQRYDARVTA